MLYILCGLAAAVGCLAAITLGDAIVMGVLRPSKGRGEAKPSVVIDRENPIHKQRGNSCGGYSAAYLMRHFGFDADGETVYSGLGFKSPKGNVPPRSVIRALRKRGLRAVYRTGSLEALKRELSRGDPVILFIHPKPGSRSLHFACAVGYDEEGILLADSARDWDGSTPYNRRVSYGDFVRMWNTRNLGRPFYSRTYIAIER